MRPFTKQSGISLIEILVALFTLSIGLLGLATMQSKSLQLNQSAYQRTQATLLVRDIVDRIRANGGNVEDYQTDFDYNSVAAPDCYSNTCSRGQMATADVEAWQQRISDSINGSGSIQEFGTTNGNDIYDISVRWEDRDGNEKTFVTRATFSDVTQL